MNVNMDHKMTTSNKFKEASDALYMGDGETAAERLAEGVAEVARANMPAVDEDTLVNAVRQKLAADPAVKDLFETYPEIKEKRAYALMADEKVAEFVAKGDDLATAITRAGDAVAKEYGLRKHSRPSASRPSHQSEASDEENYADAIADMRDRRPGSG
jgi:hypothetical protein